MSTHPSTTCTSRIPRWLKLSYTAFMAVLIPVYWHHYGLSNFLFFCDVALILTLIGVWTEKPLFISLAAVGILAPQVLWCVDFIVGMFGVRMTGLTMRDRCSCEACRCFTAGCPSCSFSS